MNVKRMRYNLSKFHQMVQDMVEENGFAYTLTAFANAIDDDYLNEVLHDLAHETREAEDNVGI